MAGPAMQALASGRGFTGRSRVCFRRHPCRDALSCRPLLRGLPRSSATPGRAHAHGQLNRGAHTQARSPEALRLVAAETREDARPCLDAPTQHGVAISAEREDHSAVTGCTGTGPAAVGPRGAPSAADSTAISRGGSGSQTPDYDFRDQDFGRGNAVSGASGRPEAALSPSFRGATPAGRRPLAGSAEEGSRQGEDMRAVAGTHPLSSEAEEGPWEGEDAREATGTHPLSSGTKGPHPSGTEEGARVTGADSGAQPQVAGQPHDRNGAAGLAPPRTREWRVGRWDPDAATASIADMVGVDQTPGSPPGGLVADVAADIATEGRVPWAREWDPDAATASIAEVVGVDETAASPPGGQVADVAANIATEGRAPAVRLPGQGTSPPSLSLGPSAGMGAPSGVPAPGLSPERTEASMAVEFLEGQMCGQYTFAEEQLRVIRKFRGSMLDCATAFSGVAAANVTLSLVQASSHPESPAVILFGVTVGDVAYWVDSLLMAGLLRFAARPFHRVAPPPPPVTIGPLSLTPVTASGVSGDGAAAAAPNGNQMGYVFQGINRLALIHQQFAIASLAVATVTTLEASAKWPRMVIIASGFFFAAAVIRSAATWWVLIRHANRVDAVESTLWGIRHGDTAAQGLGPALDRLAIQIAFANLLDWDPIRDRTPGDGVMREPQEGRRESLSEAFSRGAAFLSRTAGGTEAATSLTSAQERLAAASAASSSTGGTGTAWESPLRTQPGNQTASEAPRPLAGGGVERLGVHSSSTVDGQGVDDVPPYRFNRYEQHILRSCVESTQTAGLALAMQAFATGLLGIADLATNDPGEAIGEGINLLNKGVTATCLFAAARAFDRALYSEGCDVPHLISGLGGAGLTGVFHKLSVFAWAVALAELLGAVIPLGQDALMSYAESKLSYEAATTLVTLPELLARVVR